MKPGLVLLSAMMLVAAHAQTLVSFETSASMIAPQRFVTVKMNVGPWWPPNGSTGWYSGPPFEIDWGGYAASSINYLPYPVPSYQEGFIAIAGSDPLVRPITIRTRTSPSLPWSQFLTFPLDARMPAEKVGAARFAEDVEIVELGGRYIITGSVTNVNAQNARLEYWTGSEWLPVQSYGGSAFKNETLQFAGVIPFGAGSPLIRVYSTTAPINSEGYSAMKSAGRVDYPALAAPIRLPSGPRTPYPIKTRTSAMGLRG